MKDETKGKVLQYFTFIAIGLIIAIGSAVIYPTYRRSEDLKAKEADLRAQIEAKKLEIAKLRDNQRRFKDDADFVEKIARQNRRIFPGEIMFIFED